MLRQKSDNEIRLSRDCEFLALDVESVTGEHIGVNTMKCLLGFIADERSPRRSTLDIIARYLDFKDWDTLILENSNNFSSSFEDDRDEYLAYYMRLGQEIVITYPPNRELLLEYLGDNQFRVIMSKNSKLLRGDLLIFTQIIRHYPLLISQVIRDGQNLGSYTAGKMQGIDFKLE